MNTIELLTQARDALQKFVETDETNLDQPGNEDYAEIYYEGVRVLKELNDTLSKPTSEDAWLSDVIKQIAELPDRNSPEGQPEMMLVTAEELTSILRARPAPEGFVLVPVEPTDAMVQATHNLDLSYMPTQWGADRAAVYKAMIAAAGKE